MREQSVAEVLRRHVKAYFQRLPQLRTDRILQDVQNALFETRRFPRPIDAAAKVRNGRQDIQASQPTGAREGSVLVGAWR